MTANPFQRHVVDVDVDVVDAQRKTELNWTELNWTELNCIVQFSSVFRRALHWTGDDWRRPSQVLDSQEPASVGLRFSSNDRHCIDWPILERVPRLRRTCDDRQFRRRIVAGCLRFNAQRETELNCTAQLSWVQFSFPLCIGLKNSTR